VGPGVVDTPVHKDDSKDSLNARQPMRRIANVSDVVDTVLYLADASQVTGEYSTSMAVFTLADVLPNWKREVGMARANPNAQM